MTKNLLSCESGPISVRFLFSIVNNFSTISQNLHESHDFTIPLRSNGNQALLLGRVKHPYEAEGKNSMEDLIKVSYQSRKFECNVFSIIHLNGHNF